MRTLPALAVTTLAVLSLAGCTGATPGGTSPSPSGSGRVPVVASTNVWADVVEQVGGDLVEVTTIIDDPAADPHSFEPSTRAQLALSRAALVVRNGGGYDDFVDTMLSSLDTEPVVVDAVTVAGHGDGLNEHVWFDVPSVGRVADEVAAQLSTLDPDHQSLYAAGAATFGGALDGLTAATARARTQVEGRGVAVTEPLPLYLLEAMGLRNLTPTEFSEAIEEESDVPPAAMRQMLDLFTSRTADLLVVNEQTTGPQTEQVARAADEAGVPTVAVRETLPAGDDYVTWMSATIGAVTNALAS